MSGNFLSELFISMLRMATPLLLVALGELFSERAGMINIGLDGLMTIGAFFGFLTTYSTGSIWLGILAAIVAGVVLNMLYAYCTIFLNSQQIVTGMGLNILAPAIATFIYRLTFGISASLAQVKTMPALPIPGLSQIPFIGRTFFNQSPIIYLTFLLVPVIAIYYNRTKSGLNMRAIGEFPRAAESLGVNVIQKKYLACIICGALAGLGGGFLTLCYIGTYSDGLVAGRGFIALSAVIFGRWMPVGVMAATLVFGFADALQLRLQVFYPSIPFQLLATLPYLLTIFALIFFGSKNAGPKENGKPYVREAR